MDPIYILNQDISQLKIDISCYVEKLSLPDQPGKFYPVLKGFTPQGKMVSLGFSCFALKTYFSLGLWDTLPEYYTVSWVKYIKKFQLDNFLLSFSFLNHAYFDFPVYGFGFFLKNIFNKILFRSSQFDELHRTIFAETKQSISTLLLIGELSKKPFYQFAQSEMDLIQHLQSLNWKEPWGAGGQAAALAVFLVTQGPLFLPNDLVTQLKKSFIDFLTTLADQKSGAYFKGQKPEYSELVNGSMKVLNALEWLDAPIHYPLNLIDTCLERLPDSEGCHLVDVIYVLYRCSLETDYRKEEIQRYCLKVFQMIMEHKKPDGGFSYFIGTSQTSYYTATISEGLQESDIHGTCLLTWAIAMIIEILEIKDTGWKVMKV